MVKYKDEVLGVLHEMMKGIHEAGGISDERMREYNEMFLVKPHVSTRKPANTPCSGAPVFAEGK
jgi:DNA-binding transcriptional regulator YiaG